VGGASFAFLNSGRVRVQEIHSIYENSFNKLTERFFKSSPWPTVGQVSGLLGSSELPRLLYNELYFKHIYSRLAPSLADRIDSWNNYLGLFSYLNQQQHKIRLPHAWLFDLVDEFVWQAQSFNHYRAKVKNQSAAEKQTLAAQPEVWSIITVLQTLERLAEQSKIREHLATGKSDLMPEAEGHDFKALGYFALVAQLRLQAMLGDYHSALRAIDRVRMMSRNDEELFCSSVTSNHVSLYYYAGFSYMMLRRYADATQCFSSILLFLSRAKQAHARSFQWEQISKKQDQMLALLAMCTCMTSPRHLDGLLEDLLRDKHSDHLARLRKGDAAAFEELFSQACPKFVSASSPPLNEAGANNLHLEPLRYQQSVFLAEVRQQAKIPVIRSYLKLYSSIDTHKLASFLQVDVSELRALLLSYKHKTRSFEWSGGSPLSGQWSQEVSGDTNFYMDVETMIITETKATQNFVTPLLEGIAKLNEVLKG
jgi:translation initiation factor 3 subunit L